MWLAVSGSRHLNSYRADTTLNFPLREISVADNALMVPIIFQIPILRQEIFNFRF